MELPANILASDCVILFPYPSSSRLGSLRQQSDIGKVRVDESDSDGLILEERDAFVDSNFCFLDFLSSGGNTARCPTENTSTTMIMEGLETLTTAHPHQQFLLSEAAAAAAARHFSVLSFDSVLYRAGESSNAKSGTSPIPASGVPESTHQDVDTSDAAPGDLNTPVTTSADVASFFGPSTVVEPPPITGKFFVSFLKKNLLALYPCSLFVMQCRPIPIAVILPIIGTRSLTSLFLTVHVQRNNPFDIRPLGGFQEICAAIRTANTSTFLSMMRLDAQEIRNTS